MQRQNFACEKGHTIFTLDSTGRLSVKALLMPMLEGESLDEYWDRFYRIWEPDPDQDGMLRKRALPETPTSGVNKKRSQENADEEPPPVPDKIPISITQRLLDHVADYVKEQISACKRLQTLL